MFVLQAKKTVNNPATKQQLRVSLAELSVTVTELGIVLVPDNSGPAIIVEDVFLEGCVKPGNFL